MTRRATSVHLRARRVGRFVVGLSALGALVGCRTAHVATPNPTGVVETIFLIRRCRRARSAAARQPCSTPSRSRRPAADPRNDPVPRRQHSPLRHGRLLRRDLRGRLRRLDAQIRTVPSGATGIFLPGNHDWSDGGQGGFLGAATAADGLYVIRRQARLIPRRPKNAGATVMMLPKNGCPGPVVVDRERVRLILLDSQWWLHNYIVRDSLSDDPENGCSTHTIGEITQAVRDSLKTTHPGPVGDRRFAPSVENGRPARRLLRCVRAVPALGEHEPGSAGQSRTRACGTR